MPTLFESRGIPSFTDSRGKFNCVKNFHDAWLLFCTIPIGPKRFNNGLMILTGVSLVFTFFLLSHYRVVDPFPSPIVTPIVCHEKCKATLVESIPENLTYPGNAPIFLDTFKAWEILLMRAYKSIDLAVFYWSLLNKDVTPIFMPSAWKGERIFDDLLSIGSSRNLSMRIAQNEPSKQFPQENSKILKERGIAEVKSLNFTRLMEAGVLHTKLWIVDNKHFYLGSANMDWQSLTQVKEVGILVEDCSCLAEDMKKIFEVYWRLGGNASEIPSDWPEELQTSINNHSPLSLNFSTTPSKAFISSSPLPFNPRGRTNDIDAIVSIIRSAEKFVYIAVMDYFPLYLYANKRTFWSVIDDELRRAAYERNVEVRLLASHWNHTRPDMLQWLKSLQEISFSKRPPIVTVKAKLFVVPTYTELQKLLPFARVNHNKYMVTDKTAYIGTSNWSADYFTKTGGVSLAVSSNSSASGRSLREQLRRLFFRDWNSKYAKSVDDFLTTSTKSPTTTTAAPLNACGLHFVNCFFLIVVLFSSIYQLF